MASGVMAAHHQIIRYASERGMLDTPRTTLVAALVQAGELHWVHCGDSRLYVVRGGQLLSRTRDHSYLEAQANAGASLEGVNRNVLFTCLGSTVRPMFDVAGPVRLAEGDKLLLCSDGLWEMVRNDQIAAILGSAATPQAACDRLVATAFDNGGEDNIGALAVYLE